MYKGASRNHRLLQ